MSHGYSVRRSMSHLGLWGKLDRANVPFSFDLELTARCNNNCRHCYINLPSRDRTAEANEMTPTEISRIADEAAAIGVIRCLITGGEPLLRPDFPEIYVLLKRKGFLVSVFTNATLITPEHVRLFRQLPPSLLEITVYGATRETYEKVTRSPGSFAAFRRGLDLLEGGGVPVRLKAMAIRSNVHELQAIREFCKQRTRDYFRFDPLLHLRYDRNPVRNAEILAERLTASEIVALERDDPERSEALRKGCDVLINPKLAETESKELFFCDAGRGTFCVGHDGRFRLCSSLWHPDCLFDLRKDNLIEALRKFVPRVRKRSSRDPQYGMRCRICPIINLCLWCPAHSYLETGEMDQPVDSFCTVARARADNLRESGETGKRA